MLKKTAKLIARSPWIPNKPTRKQLRFLALQDREAFYGGQVGGGKSDALLMAALMYADVPGYSAMIFRRTFADLALPDALIPRSHEWLAPTPAKWDRERHRWTFPSGSTLTFAYMAHENDKYNYQGSASQFYGFDELTQFEEDQYKFLLSRLRRRAGMPVPLRMRSASNPGNIGHEWVYERFVVGDRPFVPASLDDNPYLSGEEYKENLRELDDVTRAQLLEGKWITDPHGKPYKREWWRAQNRYDSTQASYANACVARWISVDTAMKAKDDSDYTAICVFELAQDWQIYLRYVREERLEFPELPGVIEEEALRWDYDFKLREIVIEDKAHGTAAIQTLRATASPDVSERLIAFNPTQDKLQRARQAGVWCKRGCVVLPQPTPAVPWLTDFERQLFNFPDTTHDDMVDAFSQGIIYYEHYAAEGWRARQGEAA